MRRFTSASLLSLPLLFAIAGCGGSSDGSDAFGGPVDDASVGADTGADAEPTADAGGDAGGDSDAGGDADTDAGADASDGGATDADAGADADARADGEADADAGDGWTGCVNDDGCKGNAGGPVCDPNDGACVACTEANDVCGAESYCDPSARACAPGCARDQGCAGDPDGNRHCDVATHECVACNGDDDCPAGAVCSSHACVPGCTALHACPGDETCCGASCVDTATDVGHCGDCATACQQPANTKIACVTSSCETSCAAGFADCNGVIADGCEHDELQDGPCACTPGAVASCYEGPAGTAGVGLCAAGTRTCDASGTAWGPCTGQTLPVFEICGNGIDEDCSGTPDDPPDRDGDGWTICEGDCCDVDDGCSSTPALVNPGAFEAPGNGVDDDCDGVSADVGADPCSSSAKFASVTGVDLAKALDLCQSTTTNPPKSQRRWGVVSASQILADGSTPSAAGLTALQNTQTAVLANYGTGGIVPTYGATMAGLSTGAMRDANDPGFVSPVNGTDLGANTKKILFSPLPGGPIGQYVGQHGNALLAGKCGTSACPVGTSAQDSVDLKLVVRAPTNAKSLAFDFRFFSSEYQTFQCTAYNDYFLSMLTSAAAGIPADHNISFDALGSPVSVNNAFFQSCGGNGKSCGTCPFGTAALAGTGMDTVGGGGTQWLTTESPVVAGETLTLELVIFDVSDGIYDSLVLLDNFRWSVDAAVVSTH